MISNDFRNKGYAFQTIELLILRGGKMTDFRLISPSKKIKKKGEEL
jgi:hypothetical protein